MFNQKKDPQFEIDVWKMNNPLFIYQERNTNELLNIQNPEHELDPYEEKEILRKCYEDYSNLFSDPQIRYDDLFPAYIIRLIKARYNHLEETIKVLNGN